ncbi:hypothetical protein FWG76_00780 [Candidatus Saccharibacteria bacterium]|nr:hypothetical protein [Candidatus Saccharibacteria bacterium]
MNPEDYTKSDSSGYTPEGSSGDASSAGYAYGSADVVNNADYLGEIAAAPPPKVSVWPKRLAIIGGVIALFTALVFVVMNAASDPRPSVNQDALAMYNRARTIDSVTMTFKPFFNSGELRAVSTELQGAMQAFQRNITVVLEANGVRNPQITPSETTFAEELDQTFRDARILMTLERTYVNEMTFQIEMMRSVLIQLENKLTVIDHRNLMSDTYEELDEISERLNRIPIN